MFPVIALAKPKSRPLAIRHIMGYLATSVPGFAAIPPTKARRLVVASLERSGGDPGLPHGGVVFEKVGWGRWDARRRGQPPRARAGSPPESAAGRCFGAPCEFDDHLKGSPRVAASGCSDTTYIGGFASRCDGAGV